MNRKIKIHGSVLRDWMTSGQMDGQQNTSVKNGAYKNDVLKE